MGKLEKEELREVVKVVATLMKGVEEKSIEVRRSFIDEPRRSRKNEIKLSGRLYNTISRENYIAGEVTNTKDGRVWFRLIGSPLNTGVLWNKNNLKFIIKYFNLVITQMEEREKELEDIQEYLL